MVMKPFYLDESILDFDSWLTDDMLDNLTEGIFEVEIIGKIDFDKNE